MKWKFTFALTLTILLGYVTIILTGHVCNKQPRLPPHPDRVDGCRFGSLTRTTHPGSSMDTHKWHIKSSCVATHFPGQMSASMSVSCNWAASQVKCLSLATGQSGYAMVWSQTTYIRSSQVVRSSQARSLSQTSFLCSSAAQPPDGMVKDTKINDRVLWSRRWSPIVCN